jgi:hypothetical protein
MKDGLNFVGMAYILAYLDSIVANWGSGSVYLTGDGGDKLLPNLRPIKKHKNPDSLVLGVINNHARVKAPYY